MTPMNPIAVLFICSQEATPGIQAGFAVPCKSRYFLHFCCHTARRFATLSSKHTGGTDHATGFILAKKCTGIDPYDAPGRLRRGRRGWITLGNEYAESNPGAGSNTGTTARADTGTPEPR